MTAQEDSSLLVRKVIEVKAPQEIAFDVFANQLGTWWPLQTHHIGKADAVSAVVEPRAGGRWYEKGADGSECNWGHVIAYEPPRRLVLSWEIDADWQANPKVRSEVEVTFTAAGPGKTKVELEHRRLDAFGARAEEMRGIFGGEGGWNNLLAAFSAAAAARSAS